MLPDPYPPLSPLAMTGVYSPENFGRVPFNRGNAGPGWYVTEPQWPGEPKAPMPSPRAVRGYAFLDMVLGPVDQLAAGWAEVSHLALLLKLPHKYLTHQALI